MTTVHTLGAILGGILVCVTSYSVLRTLVVPGGRAGFTLRTVDRATDSLFRLAAGATRSAESRHHVLQAQAPVMLAGVLAVWLLGYLCSFALLLWPQTDSFTTALRESGSSLLTLGFASTREGGATAVDLVAGAT